MEDILKLSKGLKIYSCYHVYKGANKTVNCITKKSISIIDLRILMSNFLKDVANISFKDYHGSFINRLCKLRVVEFSFVKK